MSNSIIVKNIQNLQIITFNRPELRNPLSISVLNELEKIIENVDKSKIIIFTGKSNVFASGANLTEVSQLDENSAVEFGNHGQTLMQKIYNLQNQTIAAIDGFCMGGAMDLAVSCQQRIASPNSVFAHPGTKLGIITGWSGTQILPRLIGKKNALEFFLTGKRINADEAKRIGLIDEIAANPLAKALKIVSQ